MHIALPDNVTKVFDGVFLKFALLALNKQYLLMQPVKLSEKVLLMLCFTLTLDQQVIEINAHKVIQYIMEA